MTSEPCEGPSDPAPGAGIECSRYTWRPDSSLAGSLPEGFRLDMTCLTARDGARRFAPARCVLLESGTRIEVDRGGGGDTTSDATWPPGVRVIAADGRVTSLDAA